jgi:hypothetical protein
MQNGIPTTDDTDLLEGPPMPPGDDEDIDVPDDGPDQMCGPREGQTINAPEVAWRAFGRLYDAEGGRWNVRGYGATRQDALDSYAHDRLCVLALIAEYDARPWRARVSPPPLRERLHLE